MGHEMTAHLQLLRRLRISAVVPLFLPVSHSGMDRSNLLFSILLTVHPNIMIVVFTKVMHKFFILIHLLYSSTCFEHYCAHLQEDNCISTASGIVTLKTSE